MKPIAEISDDKVRGLRALCFDVDDTITTGGRLDPGAYEALCRLTEHGLVLVAATGRPLGFAQVLMQLLPIQAAVGENGAGWFCREGDRIVGHYAQDASERDRDRERLMEVRARVEEELPHVNLSEDMPLRRCDIAFDVGERVSLPKADVARLVSIIEDCGARAVASSVHAHAAFGRYDKATGVRAVLSAALPGELATKPRDLFFVGDSGNDAAAFSAFPLSAGVANVLDHLGSLPDQPAYVAQARAGQGFAEIADVLIQRKGERHW